MRVCACTPPSDKFAPTQGTVSSLCKRCVLVHHLACTTHLKHIKMTLQPTGSSALSLSLSLSLSLFLSLSLSLFQPYSELVTNFHIFVIFLYFPPLHDGQRHAYIRVHAMPHVSVTTYVLCRLPRPIASDVQHTTRPPGDPVADGVGGAAPGGPLTPMC